LGALLTGQPRSEQTGRAARSRVSPLHVDLDVPPRDSAGLVGDKADRDDHNKDQIRPQHPFQRRVSRPSGKTKMLRAMRKISGVPMAPLRSTAVAAGRGACGSRAPHGGRCRAPPSHTPPAKQEPALRVPRLALGHQHPQQAEGQCESKSRAVARSPQIASQVSQGHPGGYQRQPERAEEDSHR
jgi:hypothetical protein